MPYTLVRYHNGHQSTHALRSPPGRKFTKLVAMDSAGIRIQRVKNTEEAHMVTLDYPVARAADLMLDAGSRFGITLAASRMLQECKEQPDERKESEATPQSA